jgi:hypothetical protein
VFSARFAIWRWGTLGFVSRSIERCRTAFQAAWDRQAFVGSKGVNIKEIDLIASDDRFWLSNRLVASLSSEVEELRGFCTGCHCHPEECKAARRKGHVFRCVYKGRNGPYLHSGVAKFQQTWQKVFERTGSRVELAMYPDLHDDFLLMARRATSYIKLKFGFTVEMPWLLWRVRAEPSIASDILELHAQEAAAVEDGTSTRASHRLTVKFATLFGDDLRAHAAGEGLTQRLSDALQPYEFASLDGAGAEGVHRSVSLYCSHSSSSKFGYWASSLRLSQNLAVHDQAVADGEAEYFYKSFRAAKCILQRSTRWSRALRPRRVKWLPFLNRCYRLFPHYLQDWRWLKAEVDKAKPKAQGQATRHDIDVMKVDYLKGVIQDGDYIMLRRPSVDLVGAGPAACDVVCDLVVYHILDTTPMSKKAFHAVDRQGLLFPLFAQRLAVWSKAGGATETMPPSLDVFAEGEPELMDGFSFGSWSELTSKLVLYTRSELSDAEGCQCLTFPCSAALRPSWSIHDSSYPVYLMVQSLLAGGWRAGRPQCPHTDISEKVFEKVDTWKVKSYFRCLLCLSDLLLCGLPSLAVGQKEAYYRAVLVAKDKAAVVVGLSVREYMTMVGDLGDDEEGLPSPPPLPVSMQAALSDAVRSRKAAAVPMVLVGGQLPGKVGGMYLGGAEDDDFDEDDEGMIGANLEAVELVPEAGNMAGSDTPIAKVPDHEGDDSSSSSSSASSASGVAVGPGSSDDEDVAAALDQPARRKAPAGVPTECLGVKVSHTCIVTSGGALHERLGLLCKHARTIHLDTTKRECYKYRSMGVSQTARHGPVEAFGFLGVWLEAADRFNSRQKHMKFKPSDAEVDDFLGRHGLLPNSV